MKTNSKLFLLLCLMLVTICINSPAQQHRRTIRLLYWNIQNGMWSDQSNNYDNFVAFVKEYEPDICIWAEAKTHYKTGTAESFCATDELYLPSHWVELAARYGHNHAYLGGERDFFPQVITSKYPIENIVRLTGDEKTIITHGSGCAKVKILQNTEINIVTVHTWPQKYGFNVATEDREKSIASHEGHKCRAQELKYIYEHTYGAFRNAESEYWIMLGDFNSRSRRDNEHYKYPADTAAFLAQDYMMSETDLIDVIWAFHGKNFQPSTGDGSRIDYLYCNSRLFDMIKEAYVIRTGFAAPVRDPQGLSNFWHPSDHLPILVDFLLPQ